MGLKNCQNAVCPQFLFILNQKNFYEMIPHKCIGVDFMK